MSSKLRTPFENANAPKYANDGAPGVYDKHTEPIVGKPADKDSNSVPTKFFHKGPGMDQRAGDIQSYKTSPVRSPMGSNVSGKG